MKRAEIRLRSAVVLMPVLLALQGCYEDSTPLPASAGAAPAREAETTAEDWLDPGGGEAPPAWLSRLSGEATDDLAALLLRADARWREDPRMIANRFAALWRDTQRTLPLTRLIGEFLDLPDRREGTLSAQIQSYRVLRDQGLDHQTALRRLSGELHD